MKQQALRGWDMPELSVAALLIFVICFAAYAYWTYRKSNKRNYEQAAQLPLNDLEEIRHERA